MDSNNNNNENENIEKEFISIDELISELTKIESENFYNIKKTDFIKYFIYQKDMIVTQDKFYEIISNLILNNKTNIAILLLNSYLVNYYLRDISKNKENKTKLLNLYNELPKEKKLLFYNTEIELSEIINLLKEEKEIKNVYLKLKELCNENQKYFPEKKQETKIPKIIEEKFDIFSWEASEIAKQITIITQYFFKKIECYELNNSKWSKESKEINSPNIVKLINRFNNFSLWICEEILSYDHAKIRSKVIEKLILICEELKEINNFNDCFNIITAINNLSIKRLNKTWNKVNEDYKEKLKNLSSFCSVMKNFEHLRKGVIDYLNNEKKYGLMPYLGIFLKDLSFDDEKKKYLNEEGLINIKKVIYCGKIINDLKECQIYSYNFYPIYSLRFFCELNPLNEEKITLLSEDIEPKFNKKKIEEKRITTTEVEFRKKNIGMNGIFGEYISEVSDYETKNFTLKEKMEFFRNNNILI